ncbi:hypothetical protein N0V93_003745 [Gnomoniopsis smithogilvyi]|uniref:Uncharacterized protein n=1 Tax=Gnomoniopsis smithogilvyi TaxID=1191159 RepID=A0A9W9CZF1_9PEZI|nr:hypothetical protein N0V93_003745 [Gnomoniopsis smithogilvyi]
MWIPLLVFAGLTLIIQFSTFGYCIKVYLASLADNNATTENSAGLPSYTNSIRTMTPRQAYRRVRRVLQLQWRGIAIVLIIIADVIFFAIVFVFQDNTVQAIKTDPDIATGWIECLVLSQGDKDACLDKASGFVVNIATIGSVLILLAMNGFWLLFLLGRWSMVTGWIELLGRKPSVAKREFVSVDALGGPYDLKMNTDPRSYEMLSRDKDELVTPDMSTVREGPIYPPLRSYLANTPPTPDANMMDKSPDDVVSSHAGSGRRTPDYFGGAARYQAPTRSFSSPRPPTRDGVAGGGWDTPSSHPALTRSPPSSSPPSGRPYSPPGRPYSPPTSNPARPYSPPITHHYSQPSYGSQHDSMNPLQMNRI